MSEQTSGEQSSNEGGGESGQTLDQVYKEYGIEDTAQQFQQARQQPQQEQVQQQVTEQHPVTPAIPDPTLDPQGYRQYESQQLRDSQSLRQTLTQVVGQLSNMQQNAARQQEEADIRKAVGVLKEKIPGVDDDMLEIALGHKARRDPKFMSLWQQRSQKPEAWGKALNAVASELGSKLSARQDPQLTENTRAMKAATQAASTTRTSKQDEEWPSDPREFQKKWDSYVSSGY